MLLLAGKMKNINRLLLVLLMVLLAGCGSFRTLAPDAERKLAYGSAYKRTDCKTIPRVYSGVAIDACLAFIGPPGDVEGAATEGALAFYTIDILMSGIIDTVVLPYTLVRQVGSGSYRLNVNR